jgi:glycosyltransferase involved in cell wall biosynthesis
VLLLAHYPSRFAGTKYRLTMWGDRLRRQGHEVALALPMADRHSTRLSNDWSLRARAEFHLRMLAARTRTVFGAGGIDVAVLHMSDLPFWEFGTPFVARALRRLTGRVLLDLDDLPTVAGEAEVRPRVRALVETVDGLILGNREIAKHLPPRPSWFVPTCIEPAEWPVPDRTGREGPPLLGWVGTPGNLRNLEPLAPALAAVCGKHGARVRVVCSVEPHLPGVPTEFVRWSAEREVEDLLPLDIGIAPLLDGPRQRCKCGLKALQYMAAGVPVVASPVGALSDIVSKDVGVLASTPGEWEDALDRLCGDRAARIAMGTRARRAAEQRWSFDAHDAAFADALRGVGATSPPA